jgi:hypothetical protein
MIGKVGSVFSNDWKRGFNSLPRIGKRWLRVVFFIRVLVWSWSERVERGEAGAGQQKTRLVGRVASGLVRAVGSVAGSRKKYFLPLRLAVAPRRALGCE